MSENTETAVAFRPRDVNEAMTLSKGLSGSALLPRALQGKPADVLVVLLTGHELGLSPMQSLRNINVIQV